MPLFTLSGGLVYHARALRYRSTLWSPFRDALARWLARCLPPSEEVILVGPSGGHCLPVEQLSRFGRVSLLEPDALARRILTLRLGPGRLEYEHRDLLLDPLLTGAAGLDTLLERRPRASVLFCNLLGQLQLELSDEQQRRFQSEFRRRLLPLLAKRCWASFHDRWTVEHAGGGTEPPERYFSQRPSDDELGAAWFGASGVPVSVIDHGTSELFPPAWPRRYFSWRLTPGALHVVEGVSSLV